MRAVGRPRTEPEYRVTTSVRLPEELYEQLKEAAEDRALSMNRLMTRLLAEGVEDLVPVEEMRLRRRRRSA